MTCSCIVLYVVIDIMLVIITLYTLFALLNNFCHLLINTDQSPIPNTTKKVLKNTRKLQQLKIENAIFEVEKVGTYEHYCV